MAATRNYYAQTGILQHQSYPDNFAQDMNEYLERPSAIPQVNMQYFVESNPTALLHNITTFGKVLDIPGRNEDTDALVFDQPAPGYDKQLELKTYRTAIRIDRTTRDNDQSGKIGSMMSGLPLAGDTFMEYLLSNVINTGTTTAGSDGSNLFANDHYNERIGGRSSTWSNLESAAVLSSTSFNDMAVNMALRKNENGDPMPITPEKLSFHPSNRQVALELLGSEGNPDDALNGINIYKGAATAVSNPWLTSTTGWFVTGNLPREAWGLHVAKWSAPEVMRLAYPSATYPDIVAGWRLRIQADAGGSQAKNTTYNAGE